MAAAGLSDYGKSGSYFARQLQRWTEQYRASETETIDDMERLIAWLGQRVPADDGRIALVHGDWRIDNMIFDANAPRPGVEELNLKLAIGDRLALSDQLVETLFVPLESRGSAAF